ncbi:unnamed protein product [Microthlaspi erraticum]|uniref:Uncharacterized protein n=1 Tax=Microthlaspi erraticum TaxID=1685480 RepID=A0A6D2LN24_9BRAS|nr:unnamed protein product [Microthlaspi erraticum]
MIFEPHPSGEDLHSAYTLAEHKKLEECGGKFKLKGYAPHIGLLYEPCDERTPCPPRVSLYARMGLHRYNLLKGRKFELNRVDHYVKSVGSAASTYFMTLYAMDMEGGGASLPPETCFEIAVSEYSANCFILFCSIARIQGEEDQTKRRRKDKDTRLPEWPPVNPLYVVEKSEVQENDEWIRLYVELAVTFDFPPSRGEGDIEILDVSMDRMDEGLDAKNATFYISYKYSDDAWLGKRCHHRIAAVRRSFDEDSGNFSLVGAILPKEGAQERPLFPNLFGVENN